MFILYFAIRAVVRKVRKSAMDVLVKLFKYTDFINNLNKEGVEIAKNSITSMVVDIACKYL